ncbi:MAG: right-handed parallel beta-helix repeat-containing protein [Chloroflexota bacterium]
MRIVLRASILLTIGSLLLVASTAQAGRTIFTVTREDDVAGDTCALDDCSLRQAVSAANAASGPASVVIPAGTYHLTIPGTSEEDNLKGDLDTTGEILIQGAGQTQTTIDAGHIDQIIQAHSGSIEIDDLTLTNGGKDNTGAGGIYTSAPLTLDHVTVSANTAGAPFATAGVLLYAPGTIIDSTITGNIAAQGGAGGVFAKGPLTLTRSVISNNHANADSSAGGLLASSNVTATDSQITGNTFDTGTDLAGGVYLTGVGATHTFTNVTIADNTAGDSDAAGGLWNTGTMTATKLTVTGNTGANGGPGGIWNEGEFTVTDLVVDDNHSDTGPGGIFATMHPFTVNRGQITRNSTHGAPITAGGLSAAGRAVVTLTNVTVAGNIAESDGTGGIWLGGAANPPMLFLINATIADNGGDGLRTEVPVNSENTIFAGSDDDSCSLGSTIVYTGVNISDDDTCQMQAPNLPSTDPLLEPLADNGGFVETEAIASDSPARDAANSCPTPSEDARGAPRPAGACDIGAFEFGASAGLLWADANCSGAVDVNDTLTELLERAGLNPQYPQGCPASGDLVYQGAYEEVWGDWLCQGSDPNPEQALVALRFVAFNYSGPGGDCPVLGSIVTVQQP